jgi:hypothetical protein
MVIPLDSKVAPSRGSRGRRISGSNHFKSKDTKGRTASILFVGVDAVALSLRFRHRCDSGVGFC